MKKRNSILLGCALAAGLSCGAQQINPLTLSVINSYTELIAADPQDYMSHFERGSEYLKLNELAKAEEDLLNAIKYTPKKESAFKCQEYALLSNVYLLAGDNEKAIEALKEAQQTDSSNMMVRNRLGDLYLDLNRPEEAYKTFQGMQALKNRNQDAYYGMARAAIKLGRNQEALDLIEQIKNADQSNYLTYLRIGKVYEEMEQNEKAIANYLRSYSLSDYVSSPLNAFWDLASKDYNAANNVLTSSINASPSNVMLHFLKASLENKYGKLRDVVIECEDLLKSEDGRDPAVYDMLAMAQMALGDQKEAVENINKAVGMAPGNTSLIADQIYIMMQSDPTVASLVADSALNHFDDSRLLLRGAQAYMMAGNGEKAAATLDKWIKKDPAAIEPLVLKAYVSSEMLDNAKSGMADYAKAAEMQASDNLDLIYKALALTKSGRQPEGDEVVVALTESNPDFNSLYNIAAYYALTGNLEKAKEFADKAVWEGYMDVFNLKSSRIPLLNLQPIHHLLQ